MSETKFFPRQQSLVFLAEMNLINLNSGAKQQKQQGASPYSCLIGNGFSRYNYVHGNLLSFYITSGNLVHAQQDFEQIIITAKHHRSPSSSAIKWELQKPNLMVSPSCSFSMLVPVCPI
ncbi:hypothetical protein NE237_021933 [Protea cynaroides]|uniref:Uncharacterized protein n=1 Tax=Protea cynaroides TaxID=273540 RepID=A0A9Q0H9F4_9MAGN|nr:hypothetical protein NE237_021933 [Protea cynaroides]